VKNKINNPKTLLCLLFLLLGGLDFSFAQSPFDHKDSTIKSRNVFGADDRKAALGYSYRDYTNATAVAVEKSQFQGNYLTGPSLGQHLLDAYKKRGAQYVSSDVRFKDEPAFGFCSGFLIAPDILVTAGHCINYDDYHKMEWIFDFTNDISYKPGDKIYIPSSKRYTVKRIITRRLTNADKRDYAVIQLDRPVDRKPFRYRTGNAPAKGDKMTLLGAPSGIPLKIVENAEVISNTSWKPYFVTNLDAFGGNSGGPVYNQNGFIEGILVRGPTKGFYVDDACKCLKTSTYSEAYASIFQGVEVQKITDIPWNILTEALYSNLKYAILKKDEKELKRWTTYSWVFNEPTLSEFTPLPIVAAELGNIDALKTMIDAGASLNAKDKSGKTVMHYAINSKEDDLLKYLLREGFDINEKDEKDETPVFWAINSYNPSKLETILLFGGKADVKNRYGDTPLHRAVEKNSFTMVEGLLKNGADLFAENGNGYTACKLAKKLKYKSLKKYLKKEEKAAKKG